MFHFKQLRPLIKKHLIRQRQRTINTNNPHSITPSQTLPEVLFPDTMTTKIPFLVYLVAGVSTATLLSSASDQYNYDPTQSIRAASAGSTWGGKRQQEGLFGLCKMMNIATSPWASWDGYGKLKNSGKCARICLKGIEAKDSATQILAYDLIESILFKNSGLITLGENKTNFRKLITTIVTQTFPEPNNQHQKNVQNGNKKNKKKNQNQNQRNKSSNNTTTDPIVIDSPFLGIKLQINEFETSDNNETSSQKRTTIQSTSTNNNINIYSINCLASICTELFETKCSCSLEASPKCKHTLMKETVIKALLKKDAKGNDSISKLNVEISKRTKALKRVLVQNTFRNSKSVAVQIRNAIHSDLIFEELQYLIHVAAAISSVPKLAKKMVPVLQDLTDLCDASFEDEHVFISDAAKLDPFTILRALGNIAKEAPKPLKASVENYVSEEDNGKQKWIQKLSNVSSNDLVLMNDLSGAAMIGGGWGMLRGLFAMININAIVKGGRFVAVGRAGLLSALGACGLTVLRYYSQDNHKRLETENPHVVLANITLERMFSTGTLAMILMRISPYSFFPAFLVSMDGFDSDSSSFSFSFNSNSGDDGSVEV